MKTKEKEYDYSGISIPTPLLEEINNFITEHKKMGYKSRAEFVKEAIRKRLIELKNAEL